jgi:multiple sugar transport system permease protein
MSDTFIDNRNRVSRKQTTAKGLGNSPILWLLPSIILLSIVFLYPLIEVVRLSFTDASLVEQSFTYTFESYLRLFTSPRFGHMLGITAFFVFFSVTFQLILGFFIALLVNEGTKRKLKGTIVTRTAVLSAWAIPGVIIGIIWKMLYDESAVGVLNYFIEWLGFDRVAFLSDPTIALVSVTIANIWRGTAFSMIMIYAALQTFPNDVLEAARIDGTSALQRLTKVVIPILAPMILINMILITVQTFNTFDMVMALTGGGPGQSTEVLALSIHSGIFKLFELGQGAASAVVLFAINLVMTVVYFRFVEKS